MQELYDPRPSSPKLPQLTFVDRDALEEAILKDFVDELVKGLEKNDKGSIEYLAETIRKHRYDFESFIYETVAQEKGDYFEEFRGEFLGDYEIYIQSGRYWLSQRRPSASKAPA